MKERILKKMILLFVVALILGGCAENARRDIVCTPDIMMSALPQTLSLVHRMKSKK